jgi:tetratricopeptide (TPR) repeat protein
MKYTLFFLCLVTINCCSQNSSLNNEAKIKQQAIMKEFFMKYPQKYNLYSPEWQECLNICIETDSTNAFLWQQKAMPLFKARKYEAGMFFIDKAVKYDQKRYLDYRAFIKCIFAKTYKDAIVDFEKCIALYGNNYVMDHTYKFHIALSNLQLNNFEIAESIFKEDINDQVLKRKEAHFLDLFYYGISLYEQKKWDEAIVAFNRSLAQYPTFSEVKYYKAICLERKGLSDESSKLFEESEKDFANGYTINEDQIYYETYPYQIKKWFYSPKSIDEVKK